MKRFTLYYENELKQITQTLTIMNMQLNISTLENNLSQLNSNYVENYYFGKWPTFRCSLIPNQSPLSQINFMFAELQFAINVVNHKR